MKRLFLLAVVALLGIASAKAQTEYQLVDTLLGEDLKTRYVAQEIAGPDGLLPKLLGLAQKEQEQSGEVVNLPENKQFYVALNNLWIQYYKATAKTDTSKYVEYPSDYALRGSVMNGHVFGYEYYLNGDSTQFGIIRQFDEAQLEIDSAKVNPDLDYIGGTKLITSLELEKQKLTNIFNRIEEQK